MPGSQFRDLSLAQAPDLLPQAAFLASYTLTLLGLLSVVGSGPWSWSAQARALGPAPKAVTLLLLTTMAGLPPFPIFYAKVGLVSSALSTSPYLAPALAAGLGAGWVVYAQAAYGLLGPSSSGARAPKGLGWASHQIPLALALILAPADLVLGLCWALA